MNSEDEEIEIKGTGCRPRNLRCMTTWIDRDGHLRYYGALDRPAGPLLSEAPSSARSSRRGRRRARLSGLANLASPLRRSASPFSGDSRGPAPRRR